jgi:hypothetical protein
MLDYEYKLLVERLGPSRGGQSRFFAFADTVATRNFSGDNEQHGWIGLRFQTDPLGPSSDILLHVHLLDPAASLQQQALGALGVNLLYAVHHARASAETFLQCLWEGLSIDRMEIDVLDFTGPAFAGHDSRAWCLQLLRRSMAHAILFDTTFAVVEPSSVLRKRPLLIDRGRFQTLEPFHAKMLRAAVRALYNEGAENSAKKAHQPQGLLELTLHPAIDDDAPDDATVLARLANMVPVLPAMVTNLAEGFRLVPHLRRHTAEPIRFVGGVTLLVRILEAQFYQSLPGSLLEGMGKLFANDVKLYVYPMPREMVTRALSAGTAKDKVQLRDSPPSGSSSLISADDLLLSPPVSHLYHYLRESGDVVPIEAE